MYDNSLSSTYFSDGTNYTIDYGDGTYTMGFQIQETISFSSTTVKNFTLIEANDFDYTTDYDVCYINLFLL